jgi:hypothetical protein
MAEAAYPIFADYRRGIVVQSAKSSAKMALRTFVQGDAAKIAFTLLDWNGVGFAPGTGPNAYQTRDVAGFQLQLGLYRLSDGLQLAYQSVWTDDVANNNKRGELVQNSANVTTALGSDTGVDCYLEAKILPSGATKYETVLSQVKARLNKQLIPLVEVTVPPTQTALSVELADGRYPKAVDCLGIVFYNPTTGERKLFCLQDDGTFGPGS